MNEWQLSFKRTFLYSFGVQMRGFCGLLNKKLLFFTLFWYVTYLYCFTDHLSMLLDVFIQDNGAI